MQFDTENNVNKLCAQGMQLEGEGKPEQALQLFQQAWNEATNDMEKLTAAHYVARHQNTITDKLKWDEAALSLALKINTGDIKPLFPSLYLNIAKCYEDLNDLHKAQEHYLLANEFTGFLSDDGYSKMIRSGINNGIDRVKTV